jgi:DNA repair protein RecN (Recombination protein N)
VLTHLRISNLLVVESATLALAPGLNVLSGETGAGKSVLLAALALVTGARARSEWIRPGAERAVVEAYFTPTAALQDTLRARGFELGDDGLLLRRELRPDGRSVASCDGFPLPTRRLRELGGLLMERQDQHAQLDLVEEEAQRRLLDEDADSGHLLAAYQRDLADLRGLRQREEQLAARLAGLRGDEDYLRYQLEEIATLAPRPGERAQLEQQERRLRNASRLQETYRGLLQAIDGKGGLKEGLDSLESLLARLERLGEEPLEFPSAVFGDSLQELVRSLRARAEASVLEAREGERLAERLGRLTALERKHGRDLEAILAWAAAQQELLDQLADQDGLLAERARDREAAAARLAVSATALSERRQEAARALGARWQARLAPLGLTRAALRIAVTPIVDPQGWVSLAGTAYRAGEAGIDRVEILVRPNPDLPEGGLGELPSGGELSRIAFARHLIAEAPEAAAPVLVLDEVDAGIGADTAGALGDELAALARRRQILLVTHQARLAAVADRQFCVRKDFGGERTRTEVLALEGEARVREIARMLGESEPAADTLALAGRLLARSAGA